jgi:peptidoglycan/xylan/chitin deacetylase (PgdA/CDA1 family)
VVLLRSLKLAVLRMASALGVNSFVLESRWRRQRLVILCYHGVSLDDEHQWSPGLYIPPSLFRSRMETLRRLDCRVLGLGDAIERLYSGSLPARAVAITFDDGPYDFYRVAHPILSSYSFPATVYLTTYYVDYNRPVFDVMLSYLLWRGRGQSVVLPASEGLVSLDESGRIASRRRIGDYASRERLSARDKDDLLASIAATLGVDYQGLCARRVLHLMNPDEVRELASRGVDFQLHTHRHRVSLDRDVFLKEIEDNRACLARVSAAPAVHFCYPSGGYHPDFLDYLREAGIQSAATCDPGLATPRSNPLLLPRILDVSGMTAGEFVAWLSGVAGFLPRRRTVVSPQTREPSPG